MLLRNLIFGLIRFIYKYILQRYISFQVCSYLVIGVLNTGWNVLMFSLLYYAVFNPLWSVINIDIHYVQPHSLALIGAFILTAPVGFYLMRHFTFRKGKSSIRQQFIKYVYVLLQGLALEYIIVRVLVEWLKLEATLSKLVASAVVAVLNFFLQRHFTFACK